MPSDLDARVRRQDREDREKWMEERVRMKKANQRLQNELARITKRFKLTQTALVEQQKVLDRYQQELVRCGSKLIHADTDGGAALQKKRYNAENICNDQADDNTVKRAKPGDGKPRLSLPLAERNTPEDETSGLHSSPSRRRSLPESSRRSDCHGVAINSGAKEVWVARKQDIEGGRPPPMINATELLRSRQPICPRTSIPSTRVASRPRQHAEAADSDDEFLNDHNAITSDDKKSVMKTEPKQSEPAAPRDRSTRDQRGQPKARRRELPFRSPPSEPKPERPPLAPPSNGNTYAYVEVVRNREERAALPGHDCVECRKYYEALGGIVSEDEIKAKCSRHRARFQPYQTPDDFWRLSFPDSQSQDNMSP